MNMEDEKDPSKGPDIPAEKPEPEKPEPEKPKPEPTMEEALGKETVKEGADMGPGTGESMKLVDEDAKDKLYYAVYFKRPELTTICEALPSIQDLMQIMAREQKPNTWICFRTRSGRNLMAPLDNVAMVRETSLEEIERANKREEEMMKRPGHVLSPFAQMSRVPGGRGH